jgi:hypothetical protein
MDSRTSELRLPHRIYGTGFLSNLEDAELLVYLIDEEMDIYIGVHRTPPRTYPAGHSPAEPFSYLGVS